MNNYKSKRTNLKNQVRIHNLISIAVLFLLSLVFIVAFTACKNDEYAENSLFAMDTYITFKTAPSGKNYYRECEDIITEVESKMSRTLKSSEVYKVNESNSGLTVSVQTAEVIAAAIKYAEATNGAYNPVLGALTALWDIAENQDLPADNQIKALLSASDYNNIEIINNEIIKHDKSTALDLGGIAKGYACMKTVELLKSSGVEYGLVSFGGNIGVFGEKPRSESWIIGIKNPPDMAEDTEIVGYLHIKSGFVSVSGDYERFFIKDGIRYHHIFDSVSGYPANSGIRSVAVWCDDGMAADALSTALFVMGVERSMELYHLGVFDFEAVFITPEEVITTPGLDDIYEPVV